MPKAHFQTQTKVQKGMTPIDLRLCANRFTGLPARPRGNWLASHACPQASNDVVWRMVA
jgi:hypothetical protein